MGWNRSLKKRPYAGTFIETGKRIQKPKLKEKIMSSSEGPEQRPIIPARQARQGVTGHNVRLVLGVSLAAIIVVFAIIWIVYFA